MTATNQLGTLLLPSILIIRRFFVDLVLRRKVFLGSLDPPPPHDS